MVETTNILVQIIHEQIQIKPSLKKCLSDSTVIANKIKGVNLFLEDFDKRLTMYKLKMNIENEK